MKYRWDERYAGEGFAYGVEPNTFLRTQAEAIPQRGTVLCMADGEGRNGVFLAEQGHAVTSVDLSEVGLKKAEALAAERGVGLTTCHADLERYVFGSASWDAVVSIYCHLPDTMRRDVHRRVVESLRPGGVLILEAYTPRQIGRETGGPQVAELLFEPDDLREDFAGLEILGLEELVRPVHEGRYHTGDGAVVQLLAARPR